MVAFGMPSAVIDRRRQVLRRLRVGGRVAAVACRTSRSPPALHAAAGQEHASAPPPSGRGPAPCSAAAACRTLRRPAEFAGHDDERRIEQPAVVQVVEQCRQPTCPSAERACPSGAGTRCRACPRSRCCRGSPAPGSRRPPPAGRPSAATSRTRSGRTGRGPARARCGCRRLAARRVGQERHGVLPRCGRTRRRSPPRSRAARCSSICRSTSSRSPNRVGRPRPCGQRSGPGSRTSVRTGLYGRS